MARCLIGMFNTRPVAEQTRQELIQSGFNPRDILLSDEPPKIGQAPREGLWERIKEFFGAEEQTAYEENLQRGGTLLYVQVNDDPAEDKACDILERHNPVDISTQQGTITGQKTSTPTASTTPGEQRIPIVEEQLKVGKRQVRRGVRVVSRVIETPVAQEVSLRDERVTVERQRVNRPAQGPAFTDKTVEVTEIHEEPVVAKEARVVEEVVIKKEVGERTEKVQDTLRRTEVDMGLPEEDFRKDYQTNLASSGAQYEEYKPAYQYGYELANDPKYRGREWNTFESEARQNYERRNPGTWDRMKDTIRRSYDRIRSKV